MSLLEPFFRKSSYHSKIHVFVGAGPANLHLALKIKQLDDNAKIVIIDDRIREKSGDFEREKARANIFRFEDDLVTSQLHEELAAEGMQERQWQELTSRRNFSIAQGFQYGDDQVFGHHDFTQIQIRDLQQLFLNAILAKNKNGVALIHGKIDLSHTHGKIATKEIHTKVKQVLAERGIDSQFSQLEIHMATGAIHSNTGHAVLYPDKLTADAHANVSPDVGALMVTPIHGTATFFIKNKEGESCLTPEQLSQNQCSLDMTAWQKPLADFGWKLMRPPRIRVFYANDILYIGAEIPESMMNMTNKEEFKKSMQAYTRTIGQLVFPNLADKIQHLEANSELVTKFHTSRGEQGQVIDIDNSYFQPSQIFHHGDARYLPHYQTGSGFVTAFLQNELYADIYRHKTFHTLFAWASTHPEGHPLIEHKNPEQLFKKYRNILGGQASHDLILKTLQNDLFMAGSRDIIDKNKVKVSRYLNALHRQELLEMERNYQNILQKYNQSSKNTISFPTATEFNRLNRLEKWKVLVEMLRQDNIPFLRDILPKLLNANISQCSDEKIKRIRDLHVLDYQEQLSRPFVALTLAYEMEMQLRTRLMTLSPYHTQILEPHLANIERLVTQFIHDTHDDAEDHEAATDDFERDLQLCATEIPRKSIRELIENTLIQLRALANKIFSPTQGAS